jgi:hypothetical protein
MRLKAFPVRRIRVLTDSPIVPVQTAPILQREGKCQKVLDGAMRTSENFYSMHTGD